MHYANGRAAKIGDLVRGRGYNVKHEIIGKLIEAHPEASSCNCQVAHVDAGSLVNVNVFAIPADQDWQMGSTYDVRASIEHGQLDAFVAIDRDTGEVLPPEAG